MELSSINRHSLPIPPRSELLPQPQAVILGGQYTAKLSNKKILNLFFFALTLRCSQAQGEAH